MKQYDKLGPYEQWLKLVESGQHWFDSPIGQQLLAQQQPHLTAELNRCLGSYLLHYGPVSQPLPAPAHIRRVVRMGPPRLSVDILAEESAWPIAPNALDAIVIQHGLDFSHDPHELLRQAARSLRPGGQLIIVGLNPYSFWGVRQKIFSRSTRGARFWRSSRVADWLNLLGFALEKRQFGCYLPPLSSARWQERLAALESQTGRMPWGGFYLLSARKLVAGMRPVHQRRRLRTATLLPFPVAQARKEKGEDALARVSISTPPDEPSR